MSTDGEQKEVQKGSVVGDQERNYVRIGSGTNSVIQFPINNPGRGDAKVMTAPMIMKPEGRLSWSVKGLVPDRPDTPEPLEDATQRTKTTSAIRYEKTKQRLKEQPAKKIEKEQVLRDHNSKRHCASQDMMAEHEDVRQLHRQARKEKYQAARDKSRAQLPAHVAQVAALVGMVGRVTGHEGMKNLKGKAKQDETEPRRYQGDDKKDRKGKGKATSD